MGVVNAFMGAGLLAFWSPKMGVQMTTALSSFFFKVAIGHLPWLSHKHGSVETADGRNPAGPGMYKRLVNNGIFIDIYHINW